MFPTSEMLKLQSLQIIMIIDVIVFKSITLKFLIIFVLYLKVNRSVCGAYVIKFIISIINLSLIKINYLKLILFLLKCPRVLMLLL